MSWLTMSEERSALPVFDSYAELGTPVRKCTLCGLAQAPAALQAQYITTVKSGEYHGVMWFDCGRHSYRQTLELQKLAPRTQFDHTPIAKLWERLNADAAIDKLSAQTACGIPEIDAKE